MKGKRKAYNFIQQASAIFLMLALLWLTVSIPFVVASQQEIAKQNKMASDQCPLAGNEEEAANPFGNTTEEKAPGSTNSLSEEYLHDHHISHYIFSIVLRYHKSENAGIYNAFHGEVQVPPPNIG